MGKPLSAVKPWSDERKWEDDVEWVQFPDGKQILIRVVGDVEVLARHWIKTLSGKTFPMWCPQLNSEEEKFDSKRPCPAHDDFDEKAQKVLVGNCIVRSLQERGDDNPVRGFMLPHAVNDDIVAITEIIKSDPADPEKGVDLAVRYNSKTPGNKKWGIQRGDTTPLTKKEKAYNFYDFPNLAPNFKDDEVVAQYAKAMKEAMARNKYYVVQEQRVPEGARNPFKFFKGDANGRPWHEFKELVAFRNEQAGEDAQTHKVRGSKDDDGVEETIHDDDEAPPTKKSKPVDDDDEAPPTKKSKPVDDDDEAPPKKSKPVDDDDEAPPKKAKDDSEESSNVHPDSSIGTREHEKFGTVPECFEQYIGKAKCHKCPVRAKCIDLSQDDEDL